MPRISHIFLLLGLLLAPLGAAVARVDVSASVCALVSSVAGYTGFTGISAPAVVAPADDAGGAEPTSMAPAAPAEEQALPATKPRRVAAAARGRPPWVLPRGRRPPCCDPRKTE